MKKEGSWLLLFMTFVFGVVFTKFICPFFISILEFASTHDLLGNVVDLIGNIFIAITSALIAYFVSSYQSKKQLRELKIAQINESKTYFRLLMIEINTHKVLISNLLTDGTLDYESAVRDFKNFYRDIWDNHADNLHADDMTLEKLYKYYISLSQLHNLSEEEMVSNEYSYLRNHIIKIDQALEYLEALVGKLL